MLKNKYMLDLSNCYNIAWYVLNNSKNLTNCKKMIKIKHNVMT